MISEIDGRHAGSPCWVLRAPQSRRWQQPSPSPGNICVKAGEGASERRDPGWKGMGLGHCSGAPHWADAKQGGGEGG